jgi:tetratricopeptide (TPR) repeat protein
MAQTVMAGMLASMATGLWPVDALRSFPSFSPIVRAQEVSPAESESDREIDAHVRSQQARLSDPELDASDREEIVLTISGTLDRAAQAAADPGSQRRRWNQAVEILDTFDREHPGHPSKSALRLQAGVYRWAVARSWKRQLDLNPTDAAARDGAIAALDDALERFRSIRSPGVGREADPLLQRNIQFREAQALADRAELDPEGPDRRVRLNAAIEALKDADQQPTLKGFAQLLKADLQRRLGKLDEALKMVDEAEKSDPAPPERQVVEVRSTILSGLKRFDEAIRYVESSPLAEATKKRLTIPIRLQERESLPAGSSRLKVEEALFRDVASLRTSQSPEASLALAEVATSGLEPDPQLGSEAWDTLAAAFEIRGDTARAAELEGKAADRAQTLGDPDRAANFRLKAGALWFRAGKLIEAAAAFSTLADDHALGTSPIRSQAGLLRALSRGRALEQKLPGVSRDDYANALETQLRNFPDDRNSDEARWLLGNLAASDGNRDRALELWSRVDKKSARWIDSRLAIAAWHRRDLQAALLNGDRSEIEPLARKAEQFLADSLSQSPSESATIDLQLARARLDLLPEVARPTQAREAADRVLRMAASDRQRYEGSLLRLISQAQLNRYVDAELAARQLPLCTQPETRAVFLESIRLLDDSATSADTDLRQRRFGLVSRLLLDPVIHGDLSPWSPSAQAELKMRWTRSLIFTGDDNGARSSLLGWRGAPDPKVWDDSRLRDLADTYERLDAHELAVDVQRYRTKTAPPGSITWLDARYGLALAYYRSGSAREAAQLIDATSILHPDLGGGSLKEKFIRLRQKLGPNP